jgi:dolichyl-phosphate beta-glucosyltransferase
MLEARGEICLFSDADFSTPVEETERLMEEIDRGADVAFGSRALAESRLEVRQPLFRELSGRFFNTLVRALLLPKIRDTQCGFKAFRREAAQVVFSRQKLDGFAFDVEVLILARQAGFRLVEVPVRWINDPASKVSFVKGLQGFADLFRLRLRHMAPPRGNTNQR